MQWIAMLTMLIDHIGYVFFPAQTLWRVIGRIAFPIYAFGLAKGHLRTSNKFKYVTRLFIIALVSQVPYQLAINPTGINVVGTLFVAVIVLNIMDRISSKILSVGIVVLFGIVMQVLPFDYGAYGLILVLLYRYLSSNELVGAHILLNVMYYLFLNHSILQMASILVTMTLVYGPKLWRRLESMRVNKWIWRSFYPLHLTLIAIWKWVVW
jgi:hypothetical protein